MHNNENNSIIYKITASIGAFLPIIFWLALIFSFDTPRVAVTTLIAVTIHESGHLIAMLILGKEVRGFRGAVSGLRIKSELCGYNTELLIYLAGPLANAVAALLSAIFLHGEFAAAFIALNTATCISNLLPAEGYDGYGIIRCLLMKKGFSHFCYRLLEYISLFTVAVFCILSLYLMDRFGEGFWIFFVFFFSSLKKITKMVKYAKNEQ